MAIDITIVVAAIVVDDDLGNDILKTATALLESR